MTLALSFDLLLCLPLGLRCLQLRQGCLLLGPSNTSNTTNDAGTTSVIIEGGRFRRLLAIRLAKIAGLDHGLWAALFGHTV